MFFIGTNGSENPTKSVLPFLSAIGAVESGYEAEISLVGDAVVIMRQVVADAIVPVGWPPLSQLMAKVISYGIPIYI
jgi:predicted peroxiredoxin